MYSWGAVSRVCCSLSLFPPLGECEFSPVWVLFPYACRLSGRGKKGRFWSSSFVSSSSSAPPFVRSCYSLSPALDDFEELTQFA
jgi:hypothetical protein